MEMRLTLKDLARRAIDFVRKDPVLNRMLLNSGWLFGSSSVNLGLSFLQGVLVARALGVRQYGVLGIVMSMVWTVRALMSFRMSEFTLRFVARAFAKDQPMLGGAVAKVSLIMETSASLLAFAVVFLLAPIAARIFLKDAAGIALIRVFTFVLIANVISDSTTAILQALGRFSWQATLYTLGRFLRLLGVIIVLVLHGRIVHLLLVYVAAELIGSLAASTVAFRELTRRVGPRWWRAPLGLLGPDRREMVAFAFNTNVSSTLSYVTKNSDALWLAYFRNATEVGYFNLALILISVIMYPVSPNSRTVFPEVVRDVSLDRWSDVRRILRKGTVAALALILPGGALLLSTAWFFIPALFGDGFAPATVALLVLWPGEAYAQALFWSRPTLLALGRPGYATGVNAVLSVLKIASVLMLVPRFGYVASAATVTGYLLISVTLVARKVLLLMAEGEREAAMIDHVGAVRIGS
jgi:O-antigen/teichoic acid export membrane protein